VLKKNNIYTLLVAFLCIISTRVYAQNVTVDASIDSIQRFIGEQARIKLEVSCDASRSIHLPQFVDTLVAGVEIIDIVKADTQYLNNRERMMVTQEYIVTSFDSASYYIPPFEVMVDGQIHHSQSLALMVYPMPLDEDNPESIFPPKDIMQLPLAWVDWKPVIWKLPAGSGDQGCSKVLSHVKSCFTNTSEYPSANAAKGTMERTHKTARTTLKILFFIKLLFPIKYFLYNSTTIQALSQN
jgi:hypothetical protein